MKKKRNETLLRYNLQTLIKEQCRMPGAFKDDICTLKAKLELIDRERYRGALVRARAGRLIAGETPTKRALGLEKRIARRNEIAEIEYSGALTREKEEIERVFYDYYSTLYAHTSVQTERFKKEFLSSMPRLDDGTNEVLEEPITHEEVKIAIEALNPGKSPGPDGLSAAFYKSFKLEILPILSIAFNEAFELNVLPPTFLSSHTVLIPKTEDEIKLRQVTAYRPISLTNVD